MGGCGDGAWGALIQAEQYVGKLTSSGTSFARLKGRSSSSRCSSKENHKQTNFLLQGSGRAPKTRYHFHFIGMR
jgi:hypothetical protein